MRNSLKISLLSAIVLMLSFAAASFGQTKFEPLPENIKAVVQPESPVQMKIEGIYPSIGNYKMFGYTLRNNGAKEIRAINIRSDRDGAVTSFSLGLPGSVGNQLGFEVGLKSGASKTFSHPVNGYDGKSGGITLGIDFILFRDGTTWGPNAAEYGDWLLGVFEGQAQFLSEVKKLVASKNDQGLRDLIARDGLPPDQIGIANRTKQQIGIGAGYNVTRLSFRSDMLGRGDLTGAPARIRDMERAINGATPPDDNRKQFTVEYGFNSPLRFVGISREGQKLAFDDRFLAAGDWLTGTRLRLKNESDKTIKAVSLGMFFPETTNTGLGMSSDLRYGPNPITYVENPRHPRIAPGQSFEISVDEERPGTQMRFLLTRPDGATISRALINVHYIEFEDGTRWDGGQWMKQDPENPKRWIPVKP